MRKNKYLDFHIKRFGNNMPCAGLCANFADEDRRIKRLSPTISDIDELERHNYSSAWWGSGCKCNDDYFKMRYAYTPLRQTIVLFMSLLKEEDLYEETD